MTEDMRVTTEDMNVGVKNDADKLRYDLIPVYPLEQLAAVYTYGANKYKPHNWRKGLAWSRIFAALMRHLWSFWGGEPNDRESRLPHLAHAAWGCFTLLAYTKMKLNPELDDRQKDGADTETCISCSGSGFLSEGMSCCYCDGTGVIAT